MAEKTSRKGCLGIGCFGTGCLGVGCLVVLVLAAFFLMGSIGGDGRSSRSDRTAKAAAALAYLPTEVPEVKWVEVDGNNAYVGFSPVPGDIRGVVNGAAFNGNRAIGFGFHVWAVNANTASKGWRPGAAGLICEATARKGRVTDSSCPKIPPS